MSKMSTSITGFSPDPVSEPDIAAMSRAGSGRNRAAARVRTDENRHAPDAGGSRITRRGDNTRLERATDANMARLDSTLRRIERYYEYDASKNGEEMRLFVAMMRLAWRDWASEVGHERR